MASCEVDTERMKRYLLGIAEEMQDDPNLISDKTYKIFKTYPSVFIGSEAVDWFVKHGKAATREAGVLLGQQLIDFDFVHHVHNDHNFKDAHLFYRFRDDDPLDQKLSMNGPSVASLLSECGVGRSGYLLKKGNIFWNNRFVICHNEGGMLYYYNSDLDASPRQSLKLGPDTKVTEVPDLKKSYYCFQITTPNEIFQFAAKSSKDQESWIENLVQSGAGYQEEDLHVTANSIFEFNARTITGEDVSLSQWNNNVCLVVNVASK